MARQQLGAWHTLTVAHDGEDEDGTPLLDYDLAHPDSCPPAEIPAEPQVWPTPRCHLDHIIQESGGDPDEYGIPTEPGSYRLRAWSIPGHWCGSYYCDPEDGIEVDEPPIPLGFPYWYRTPPRALTRGHTDVIDLGMLATSSPLAIAALLTARGMPPITRSGFLADVVETVERAAATARHGEPPASAIHAAGTELAALFHAVLAGVYVGRWDW